MQGLLSLNDGAMLANSNRTFYPESIAQLAVQHAKALIEALNKEES